ncbi:MAG: tRNA uridine-5-carboxymethylaminomethyl(34) synthesis enzyme MnmG [Bacillota bacterium]|jgi:tRNA uridine 5-carboxymethylaminomethyl modification enzyme
MARYEVIVIGGGHAGLEAAFAAANMGAKTLLITLNKKMMGNMPCNPSIGGSAKGIVVREIDALGGKMGIGADAEYLQMKMLNTGKGPGVQCLRAQVDKLRYPRYMQKLADETENLTVKEGMVLNLLHDDHHVFGVVLANGESIESDAVILTTGTYMESEVLVGLTKRSAGPDGEKPSLGLSPNLAKMGIELFRLKTGTPPRLKRDSIDFSKMDPQYPSEGALLFSSLTPKAKPFADQALCYLIHTQPQTHEIIRQNLKQSAMFGGLVTGVGPRYCPSIEDKVVRFADKERHQLFIEPESAETDSMYLQGFSTSMPPEIQEKMVRSLPGLEQAVFLKYAYAIEYDAIVPTQFDLTLELKKWPGLYGAGQIFGTSGYEEAAGAGIMAGINAVRKIRKLPPVILRRDQAYIGVMIDDLVTKGTQEPYRLLSSRAEYRLLLRHDNAAARLTEIGHDIGLVKTKQYNLFKQEQQQLQDVEQHLKSISIRPNPSINAFLATLEQGALQGGITAYELLRRPQIKFNDLIQFFPTLKTFNLSEALLTQLEVNVKFVGYIEKEVKQAQAFAKYEDLTIPHTIDYASLAGMAMEARQKLSKIRPLTIGQASRISGVNPSDISLLVMQIKKGFQRGTVTA